MEKTSTLHRDYNPDNPNPRAKKSKKWEIILKPIWQDIVEEDSDFDAEGNGLILVKDPFRDGKLYLRKNSSCYCVKNVQSGDGLFLSPQHPSSSSLPGNDGDGLFIKEKGGRIFNGDGLIFDKKNDPFKYFSILELLL